MVTAWPCVVCRDGSALEATSRAVQANSALLSKAVAVAARVRLEATGYSALTEVECWYFGGVLTLRGHVSSYYLKQIAQTAVRGLEQVEEIVNRLEVDPPVE